MSHNLFHLLQKWTELTGAVLRYLLPAAFCQSHEVGPFLLFTLFDVFSLLFTKWNFLESTNENIGVCTPVGFKSHQFRNPELFQVLLAVLRLAISILICENGTKMLYTNRLFLLTRKPFGKVKKKSGSQVEQCVFFTKRGQHKYTLWKCFPAGGPQEASALWPCSLGI